MRGSRPAGWAPPVHPFGGRFVKLPEVLPIFISTRWLAPAQRRLSGNSPARGTPSPPGRTMSTAVSEQQWEAERRRTRVIAIAGSSLGFLLVPVLGVFA